MRASAYDDPRLKERVSYAAQEAEALKWSRVPMPAFAKSAQAKDIAVEEMQAAMLGMQKPEQSARNMARHLTFTDRSRADRLVDRFLKEPY